MHTAVVGIVHTWAQAWVMTEPMPSLVAIDLIASNSEG